MKGNFGETFYFSAIVLGIFWKFIKRSTITNVFFPSGKFYGFLFPPNRVLKDLPGNEVKSFPSNRYCVTILTFPFPLKFNFVRFQASIPERSAAPSHGNIEPTTSPRTINCGTIFRVLFSQVPLLLFRNFLTGNGSTANTCGICF